VPKPERLALLVAGLILVVGLPLGNLLPPGSPLHVSNFTLNLFGKFLTYAILALGLDLLWGYAGVLSLGHGVFFGLGAYAMGMHLLLELGSKSVYQSALPDVVVWNQVKSAAVLVAFHSAASPCWRSCWSRRSSVSPSAVGVPEPDPRCLLLDHPQARAQRVLGSTATR
jgi:ABC-type branched-subunit amino acid transport system permease subunit